MKNSLMKRFLALLLAAAMLFTFAAADEAETDDFEDTLEEGIDFEISEEDMDDYGFYPNTLFALNGHVYALSYSSIYLADGEKPVQLDVSFEDGCVAAAVLDGQLLILTGDSNVGFSIVRCGMDGDTFLPPEKLCDLSLESSDDDWVNCNGFVASGDSAWVLLHSDNRNKTWDESTLYRVALQTGETTAVSDGYWSCLQPYRDGLLCAYWWDQQNAYADWEHIVMPTIVSVDPATGESQTLHTLSSTEMRSVCYDPETSLFYFCDTSKLYSCAPGDEEEKLAAYLLPGWRQNATTVIAEGRYWYIDNTSSPAIFSASIDPDTLPSTVLRIAGIPADSVVDFAKQHPEIAIDIAENFISDATDITTRMVSADGAADLYSLSLSYSGFASLRDKGYCVDLSGSDILRESVARMYPNLTSAFYRDGHLYAYPGDYNLSCLFSYSPSAMETAGLTENDLPHTMIELIDFMLMWQRDYAEAYPDIQLFDYMYSLRQNLFYMAINLQSAMCSAAGEPLKLNTPGMRAFLAKLDEAGPALDAMSAQPEEGGVYSWDSESQYILTNNSDLMPSLYGHWMETKPLLLSLAGDAEPLLIGNMNLWLVNPNGASRDAAITYLEYLAQHLNPGMQIALMPDFGEPVESPNYADSLRWAEEWLESAKEFAAEDPNDRDAQESLEDAQQNYDRVLKDRWAITQEEIDTFHNVYAPLAVIPQENVFTAGGSEELSSFISRYLDGQLSADQMLQQCDRVLQMIQFENQ